MQFERLILKKSELNNKYTKKEQRKNVKQCNNQ